MNMKQVVPMLAIVCILVILSIPMMASSAQSGDEAPDFLITLALMAVADDRMDGVLNTADLSNLRDLVDEYYSNQRVYQMTPEMSEALNHQKITLLNALDQKIEDQLYRVNQAQTTLLFSLSRIGDHHYVRDENDPNSLNVDEKALNDQIMGILAGGHKPDQSLIDLLNQRLDQDVQGSLEKDLDGHVAKTIEGGDQWVAQTSDTTYDFSAGLSKEAYLDLISQTKPLLFINHGARDVTVSIEYYVPPEGLAISAPGLNLTVPKENKITANGFPQGNYTFCAQWQTDMDTDGDGIKDYDRMVTHIWLSSAHSDDPNTAEVVYVNSVGTATPIGRCDGLKGEAPQTETLMAEIFMTEGDIVVSEAPSEGDTDSDEGADFWDQDPNGGDNGLPTDEDEPNEMPDEESSPEVPAQPNEFTLTPAELANQGQHNYEITCVRSWGFTDTNSVSANWAFTAEGVTLLGEGGFVKISDNVYQNDFPTTITFTTSGYQLISYVYETDSEGVTTTYETNCTAILQ